ncbi:hypothetical protein GUITHDRAFT_120947 [Guillardia theta CCMP2712]|uniref:Uncharacterized protein n=1 Tax=Guillardia theta (strain CCMP2712) TaxID=905079 RepID=L1IAF7_GUITC|nr:hypothetical protein GUITHDRAFT_120947 [Guillardia theta CCMP2712]EKX32879.1 hypothetical protein GUITHDRAFT_120947 [Guillardia theta CCMP2712]|eukprot:XP_005819859.1 hypothetical protein GUITHDRAFT_120947 [Guillardia theta CCMP2712]
MQNFARMRSMPALDALQASNQVSCGVLHRIDAEDMRLQAARSHQISSFREKRRVHYELDNFQRRTVSMPAMKTSNVFNEETMETRDSILDLLHELSENHPDAFQALLSKNLKVLCEDLGVKHAYEETRHNFESHCKDLKVVEEAEEEYTIDEMKQDMYS